MAWLLGLLLLFLGSCANQNPQLFFGQEGNVSGTPKPGFGGRPAGDILPNIINDLDLQGVGSQSSESKNFKSYSSVSPVYGGVTKGSVYQIVSPQLSLAEQRLEVNP